MSKVRQKQKKSSNPASGTRAKSGSTTAAELALEAMGHGGERDPVADCLGALEDDMAILDLALDIENPEKAGPVAQAALHRFIGRVQAITALYWERREKSRGVAGPAPVDIGPAGSGLPPLGRYAVQRDTPPAKKAKQVTP